MLGTRTGPALLAAMLLAACTSGDEDTAPTDDGPEATTQTPAASSGCDTIDPVETVTAEPGRVDLESGGEARWYLRQVPPAAADGEPLPVIVDVHGYSEGAEIHFQMSALGELGRDEGFVTIFPHGDAGGRVVPGWDWGADDPDVAYFGHLLDDVEATLCVDTDRVYVTGLSNGAFLASTLACTHAERIAAIAPVAGIRSVEPCDASRPVPIVAFHGTDDDFVAFEGGFGSAVADLPTPDGQGTLGGDVPVEEPPASDVPDGPSIPEIVAEWAERNGCGPEPEETRIADDVLLVAYDCPVGAAVELYVIEGGGHAWPGSELSAAVEAIVGFTTFSISANEIMWDFFAAHPLPR